VKFLRSAEAAISWPYYSGERLNELIYVKVNRKTPLIDLIVRLADCRGGTIGNRFEFETTPTFQDGGSRASALLGA